MLKNDLKNPYDPHRSQSCLEEFLILCIFVAGKRAKQQSEKLEIFLDKLNNPEFPISALSLLNYHQIYNLLLEAKTGQYSRLAKCLYNLSGAKLDLTTCTCEQLEAIPGIGMKTSRFFITYSRENTNHAVLDTHILSWLREFYPDAPKSTPANVKQYKKWELIFLNKCSEHGLSPHELDLNIWKQRQKSYII